MSFTTFIEYYKFVSSAETTVVSMAKNEISKSGLEG